MKKTTKADFKHAVRMAYWTTSEAAHYLCGIEPGAYKLGWDVISSDDDIGQEIYRIYDLLKRDFYSGNLKGRHPVIEEFSPYDVRRWAEHKEIPIPEELTELLENKKPIGSDMPSYLNPKHKHFSEELSVAVHAWIALFENGEYIRKKAPKLQIEKWLRENYQKKFSVAAIERISTVVNPKKGGGAPPIE